MHADVVDSSPQPVRIVVRWAHGPNQGISPPQFTIDLLEKIAYEESGRSQEIDDVILVLSASVQRVQNISSQISPARAQSALLDLMHCCGIDVLSTVAHYLHVAISHFKRSLLSLH